VLEKLLRILITLPGGGTGHLEAPANDGPQLRVRTPRSPSIAPPDAPALDLTVDDVYDHDETVEIRCGLANSTAPGPAEVEITGRSADGRPVALQDAVEADCDGYRWSAGSLPAGGYLVTLRVPSLGLAASDVFEVC